jgi:hypothetical protein
VKTAMLKENQRAVIADYRAYADAFTGKKLLKDKRTAQIRTVPKLLEPIEAFEIRYLDAVARTGLRRFGDEREAQIVSYFRNIGAIANGVSDRRAYAASGRKLERLPLLQDLFDYLPLGTREKNATAELRVAIDEQRERLIAARENRVDSVLEEQIV